MKVILEQSTNHLLIVPETIFEAQWMLKYGRDGLVAFHKTGLTPADYLGIKILPDALKKGCCPLCGHEWERHDPEDGRCDAGPPCKCGRDLEWMQEKIAEKSRECLRDINESPL